MSESAAAGGTTPDPPLQVRAWHHVSLSVSDLEESERFFVEVLGLRVLDHVAHDGWRGVIGGDPATRLAIAELDVDHTPIASREYGDVLTFRHPDGVQPELFVLSADRAAAVGFQT